MYQDDPLISPSGRWLLWHPMAYWLKDLESDTNLEVSSKLAVENSASKMLQKIQKGESPKKVLLSSHKF
jgi:hypothetical protein